ncbi:MAG: hypothetical protein ACLQMT_11015 [Candidatus Acidiferrales bacterium]
MRFLSIGLALAFLLSQTGSAEPGGGTVCVASRADDPFRGQVIPPTGEVSSGGLQVKIDKRPAVAWPQRKSLKIDGLDLSERHLLAVIDSRGKPVESLWFRFSDYGSVNLCMDYDGYQGVGLQEASRHTPWCKCK